MGLVVVIMFENRWTWAKMFMFEKFQCVDKKK